MSLLSTQKNCAKPSPVPSSPTKKPKPGFVSAKASETASEMGATVDEPWMSTVPSTSWANAVPAMAEVRTAAEIAAAPRREVVRMLGFPSTSRWWDRAVPSADAQRLDGQSVNGAVAAWLTLR